MYNGSSLPSLLLRRNSALTRIFDSGGGDALTLRFFSRGFDDGGGASSSSSVMIGTRRCGRNLEKDDVRIFSFNCVCRDLTCFLSALRRFFCRLINAVYTITVIMV